MGHVSCWMHWLYGLPFVELWLEHLSKLPQNYSKKLLLEAVRKIVRSNFLSFNNLLKVDLKIFLIEPR
jgi:hypothetical protein